MHFLIYISTSLKLMEQDQLSRILTSSRKNNSELGITGMLMYSQGTFIQVLEGEEHTISNIYAVIEKDDSHKNLVVLASGPLNHRVFPEWSMAFLSPDSGKMSQLEGYINPLKNKLFEEEDRSTIINILRTFADNNDLTLS